MKLLAGVIIGLIVSLSMPVVADSPAPTCPVGTYNINTIDEPICKAEPTGCPYGDSIPMDKCEAPVSSNPVKVQATVVEKKVIKSCE